MPRTLVVALSAPMLLIGAAYPSDEKPPTGVDRDYEAPMAGPVTYRPCRPGRGDDRCIQLYERGVRTAYAQWLRERGPEAPRTRLAMGGPAEETAPAPPRRRHHAARRCIEERGDAHRADHGHHADDAPAESAPSPAPEPEGYGGETRGM